MAELTFVGATRQGESVTTSGVTSTVPLPAGCAAGDLAIIGVEVNGGTSSHAGGNLIGERAFTFGNQPFLRIYSRVLSAADVNAGSVTVSLASTAGTTVPAMTVVHVYRGANLSVSSVVFTAAGAATSVTPSFTTTSPLSQAMLLFGTGTTGSSGGANSVVPGWTQTTTTGNTSHAAFVAHRRTDSLSTPGSYGGETSPASGAAGNHSAVVVIKNNTAPSAPTWATSGGTAEGATVDRTQATPLAWVPSDPDGDPQVGYDLRWRPAGSAGAYVTVSRPTAGATPSGTIPAGSLAGRCAVSVRTYDSVGPGEWSADRLIIAVDPAGGAVSTAPSQMDPLGILALHTALQAKDSAAAAADAVAGLTPSRVGIAKAQGVYVGNATADRFIPVGFTPDLVLVSMIGNGQRYGWLHWSDATAQQTYASVSSAGGDRLVAGGFIIGAPGAQSPGQVLNVSNISFAWTAFKFS